MKRIGSLLSVFFVAIMLGGFFTPRVLAQSNVSVQSTVSQTTVYTGERIQLSIKISGDFNNVSRPRLPDFPGFRLLSNSPSTSRSYQYVNGQTSITYAYSYQLIAQQKGNYKIPPIPISIDDKEYKTDPIDIAIIDRNESARASGAKRPDIFLQLEVSDDRPVTGQQVIADVVLYFQDGIEVNSYQPVPGWKAEGFWKEELKSNERPKATSTVINGVRYRRARLLQFALFPTKNGKLKISPYTIMVSVRSSNQRENSFSNFFGNFGGNRRQVELKTDPVMVNVQPPPESNKSYFGAVGQYDISRSISTQEAIEGESIEITTRISGTGNIPLISKPDYELPDGLEVYAPKETSDLNRANHRISGTKTFTDIIIARKPGQYSIPEKQIAYFNPAQNSYVSTTLPALNFTVRRNPDAVVGGDENRPMPVSPITGLATWVHPNSQQLLTYWWFWAGLILPICVLAVAYWQKHYYDRMANDLGFARSQKAADKASDRLDQAIKLSEEGNIKQAYNMLQKAITSFIGDRLNLSEAGLSHDEYLRELQRKNIDSELIENIRMLLDKCASISYAPSTSHEYLKSHVGLAQSTLDKLKKVL